MHQVDVEYMYIGSKRFIKSLIIKDGLYTNVIKYRSSAPFFTQDQCQILDSVVKRHNDSIYYKSSYSLVGNLLTETYYNNKLIIIIIYHNIEAKTIKEIQVLKDNKDITSIVKEDFVYWPMVLDSDIDFIKLKHS